MTYMHQENQTVYGSVNMSRVATVLMISELTITRPQGLVQSCPVN